VDDCLIRRIRRAAGSGSPDVGPARVVPGHRVLTVDAKVSRSGLPHRRSGILTGVGTFDRRTTDDRTRGHVSQVTAAVIHR